MQILLMVGSRKKKEILWKDEAGTWCRSLLLRFSVTCIVVAILGYGMMSMYWCCRLSLDRVVVLCPGHGVRWQGIGHTDPLPAKDHKPHRSRGSVEFLLLETQNNNPMQSTASSTNTCSPFHRKGQRSQCRTGVCCRSGRLLSRCFLPWVFSPLTVVPPFFRLWVLVCVALCIS